MSTEREKTGVPIGSFAVSPATGERLPIWIADYVLAQYGTGAIMAVPASDERDWDFARKFNLPIRVVVRPPDAPDDVTADELPSNRAYIDPGIMVNSGQFNGLPNEQALERIIADNAFVHGHQVGRVPRGNLCGKLRIAGPRDDIDVDVDVGVLGIEAVDQSSDDPALALGFGDVDAAAILRATLTEETLQIEVDAMIGLRAAAERQRNQQSGSETPHRTAAPAIARTICFWKTI